MAAVLRANRFQEDAKQEHSIGSDQEFIGIYYFYDFQYFVIFFFLSFIAEFQF